MSGSTLISVRVSNDIARQLADLANVTECSRSYLVEQALEEFIARQEWQVKAVRQGIRQADTGRLVEHKEALKILNKWSVRRAWSK